MDFFSYFTQTKKKISIKYEKNMFYFLQIHSTTCTLTFTFFNIINIRNKLMLIAV